MVLKYANYLSASLTNWPLSYVLAKPLPLVYTPQSPGFLPPFKLLDGIVFNLSASAAEFFNVENPLFGLHCHEHVTTMFILQRGKKKKKVYCSQPPLLPLPCHTLAGSFWNASSSCKATLRMTEDSENDADVQK